MDKGAKEAADGVYPMKRPPPFYENIASFDNAVIVSSDDPYRDEFEAVLDETTQDSLVLQHSRILPFE